MYEDVKTAAIYARYSSTSQTEQSIEGQLRVCQEFCANRNIQVVSIYTDRATSASKDLQKRTNFLKMISDSEHHGFDAVVVYKLDRFSRSRYDMATYKYKLKKNGVLLISATENISNDPEGIILESVLEGMAEFYSAELSQKISRGHRESAFKHQYIGGTIPFGYKIVNKKLAIDEEKAPYVVEAFTRYANGETVASICRSFNERGVKTAKGNRFGKSSFVKIFRNEKYIGKFQYHDYVVDDGIPAIISKDLWDRVQMRLDNQKAPGSYKAKDVYLLSGKVYCGNCGYKLVAGRNSSSSGISYGYYICGGKKSLRTDCKLKTIRKDYLEDIVLKDAYSLLTDENIELIADEAIREHQQELSNTTHIPEYKNRLSEINKSLNNLMSAIESGQAPDILVQRISELEKEKKIIEKELREEEKYIPKNIDKEHIIYWLEHLKDGDIEDKEFQKQLIDLFVYKVTVNLDDTVTITYNLSEIPSKNVGFSSPTSKLVTKSNIITYSRTIKIRG